MDPTQRPVETGTAGGEGATSLAGQELLQRLSALRSRLESAAIDDPMQWRQAGEVIRQSEERLRAIDHMLSWAREREAALTARLASAEMRTAALESRAKEADAIREQLSQAQLGRSEAEADAAAAHELLASTQRDLDSARLELGQLRARVIDLENDVATLTSELATSMLAASRVERLERQRDIALERAHIEARTLLDERIRAAEAEHQVIVLRERLDAANQAYGSWSDDEDVTAESDPFGQDVPPGATAPLASGPGGGAQLDDPDSDDTAETGSVIDLTDDGWVDVDDDEDDEDEDGDQYEPDEVVVWGPPERGGLVGWLRRGRHGEDAGEQDYRDDDR